MSTRVALEQRRELVVDRRLREVELDELDLATRRECGRANVEREDAPVAPVFVEPAQQLSAEVRRRAGDGDDALGRGGEHAGLIPSDPCDTRIVWKT